MDLKKNIPALEGKTVIFFDGVCNLCNGVVRFILKRDRNKRFHFASLQSDAGKTLLTHLNAPAGPIDSILLYENGKVYVESTAALKILKALPGVWKVSGILLGVPSLARNFVYKVIARNRYKWFGKQGSCMMPEPGIQSRFLS